MPLKPGARPARALPVNAPMPFSGPLRNNGWVALRVHPKWRRQTPAVTGGPHRTPTSNGIDTAESPGMPGGNVNLSPCPEPTEPVTMSGHLSWNDADETGGTPGPGAAGERPDALQRAPAEQRMGGAEGAPKGRRETPVASGGPSGPRIPTESIQLRNLHS